FARAPPGMAPEPEPVEVCDNPMKQKEPFNWSLECDKMDQCAKASGVRGSASLSFLFYRRRSLFASLTNQLSQINLIPEGTFKLRAEVCIDEQNIIRKNQAQRHFSAFGGDGDVGRSTPFVFRGKQRPSL